MFREILYKILSVFLVCIMLVSCTKYLDEKPLKNLIIPTTIADLQALLDNYGTNTENYNPLLEIAAGDFFVTTADYNANPIYERTNYLWDKDATYLPAYQNLYKVVAGANTVLEAASSEAYLTADQTALNNIRGQALFFRAFAFYQSAQLYCQPYSSSTLSSFGIPMRLTASVDVPSTRTTVEGTYSQIISDLTQAAQFLNESNGTAARPNKAAAYGALARTYLSMRDYANAGKYADSVLVRNSQLMDYNTLNAAAKAPIARFNIETVSFQLMTDINMFYSPSGKIDTTLYRSYDVNDLRKTVYFLTNTDGSYSWKGSYNGTGYYASLFCGITTDEMLLIRAEVKARSGDQTGSMNDLNNLLAKRYKSGTFVPLTANSAADALSKVKTERRKELIFRGLRWTDLRRYNLEGDNITMTRIINGSPYTLPPNDLRWVLLLPTEAIALSTMQQNPR